MARPVEHDKQEVIFKAMKVFWLKGYEATSIRDLVQATGMTSRSMYNTFGSKNGLFKAALESYFSYTVGERFKIFQKAEGLDAIAEYVLALSKGTPLNGCLFANTVSERNSIEKDALQRVESYFKQLETEFERKLTSAKQNGLFQGSAHLVAKQLITIILGLTLYSKTESEIDSRIEVASDFLERLGVAPTS